MASFADALRALESLKRDGVVEDYAVAGAMAILFWTEPVPTYDLDVLVFLPTGGEPLVSLDRIYRWAASRGYASEAEHVLIEGVPTQFVPSPNALADEAIRSAERRDYEGVAVRVVRPEYLVALYLEPASRTATRQARAAMLLELPHLNRSLLDEILSRHGLQL
jgi:uncharacterized protein (DUF1684 family)